MGNLCERLCGSCCGDRPIIISINNPINNNSTIQTNIGRNDDKPIQDETKQELILKTDRNKKSKRNATKEVPDKVDKEKASDEQEIIKPTSTKSGIKEVALKSAKFYYDKIGLPRVTYSAQSKIYKDLKQFDYGGEEDFTNLIEYIGTTTNGVKWIYIGQMRPGTQIREGVGIFVSANGAIVEGYWQNDMPNGYGRNINPDGSYYIGDFKDGLAHGHGEYHYENGDVYIGQLENNKANEQGEYRWKDGRVYIGQFKDHYKHGQGTLTYTEGTKVTGLWKDDEFIG